MHDRTSPCHRPFLVLKDSDNSLFIFISVILFGQIYKFFQYLEFFHDLIKLLSVYAVIGSLKINKQMVYADMVFTNLFQDLSQCMYMVRGELSNPKPSLYLFCVGLQLLHRRLQNILFVVFKRVNNTSGLFTFQQVSPLKNGVFLPFSRLFSL